MEIILEMKVAWMIKIQKLQMSKSNKNQLYSFQIRVPEETEI